MLTGWWKADGRPRTVYRRHRQAVWRALGAGQAVLAGSLGHRLAHPYADPRPLNAALAQITVHRRH